MKLTKTVLSLIVALVMPATETWANTIYSEDFESGAANGFVMNGLWHVTENAPKSGAYALGFVHSETAGPTPDGSYAGTTAEPIFAYSPEILLPNSGNIVFTFDARVDDEFDNESYFYDVLSIGISLDGGLTEDTVLATSGPYSGGVVIPENTGYHSFSTDLSSFAGQSVVLTFSFWTLDQSSNDYPGPRIDNLSIRAIPEPTSFVLFGLGGIGLSVRGFCRRRDVA